MEEHRNKQKQEQQHQQQQQQQQQETLKEGVPVVSHEENTVKVKGEAGGNTAVESIEMTTEDDSKQGLTT